MERLQVRDQPHLHRKFQASVTYKTLSHKTDKNGVETVTRACVMGLYSEFPGATLSILYPGILRKLSAMKGPANRDAEEVSQRDERANGLRSPQNLPYTLQTLTLRPGQIAVMVQNLLYF